MITNLDVKRNLSLRQISDIFQFELLLSKKRFKIMLILSLIMYNLAVVFLLSAPNALIFSANAVGQHGSFLILITLFITFQQ